MVDWVGTGLALIGLVLMWVSIVQMVLWYRANPSVWRRSRADRKVTRAEARETNRQIYGRFWPLCGSLGIFLMGFGTIIDGDATPWRIALSAFWGGVTVVALIAYLRLRPARRRPGADAGPPVNPRP